jgi:phosphoribosylaminoimidazole-succinocarboxamide synthase
VLGIPLPEGLQESQKLPTPLFTPSTKAEQGAHDENISPEQGGVAPIFPSPYSPHDSTPTPGTTAAALIGADLYDRVSHIAPELYIAAAEHAATRGLIIADTKFEFGLVDRGELILIDEALTPDSSRKSMLLVIARRASTSNICATGSRRTAFERSSRTARID